MKKKFIDEPGQMKLLIVVDKLLTGFDAPPATYLYIDKQMRDHGLFQAICRVNRLDGDDKEYGYIIDYKDLFKSLEGAVTDYTSGALDGYDKEDVAGLLEDRLEQGARAAGGGARGGQGAVRAGRAAAGHAGLLATSAPRSPATPSSSRTTSRSGWRSTSSSRRFVRAYANLANEMAEAGYTDAEIEAIKAEVDHYEKVRNEVKLASGDYIDLKMYEPAMRHLIDTYIRAEESEKVSAFDDLSLVQLIVERGADAVDALPEGIRKNKEAVAETIENNVRKLIIDEQPINPKYYEKMSELLDALIEQRKQEALDYQEYLAKIVELTKQVKNRPERRGVSRSRSTPPAKRALYDNLEQDEALALAVDQAVRDKPAGRLARAMRSRSRRCGMAIKAALERRRGRAPSAILELVKNQNEY